MRTIFVTSDGIERETVFALFNYTFCSFFQFTKLLSERQNFRFISKNNHA